MLTQLHRRRDSWICRAGEIVGARTFLAMSFFAQVFVGGAFATQPRTPAPAGFREKLRSNLGSLSSRGNFIPLHVSRFAFGPKPQFGLPKLQLPAFFKRSNLPISRVLSMSSNSISAPGQEAL